MRRLQITMPDEMVQALMQRSRRTRRPLTALVVEAVEAWLASAPEANRDTLSKCKDSKRLRGT